MGVQVAHCTWVPYLRGRHSCCRHRTQSTQVGVEFWASWPVCGVGEGMRGPVPALSVPSQPQVKSKLGHERTWGD